MGRRSTLKGRSEGEEDHHKPEEEVEAEVNHREERDRGAEVLKAEVQREEETVEVQPREKAPVQERMEVQREIEVLKEVQEIEAQETEAPENEVQEIEVQSEAGVRLEQGVHKTEGVLKMAVLEGHPRSNSVEHKSTKFKVKR